MKGLWSLVVALVLTLGAAAVAAAQAPPTGGGQAAGLQRMAFIDVQRVLGRSASGVAAREQLEREKAQMQKEMDGKRVELEKLREELEKKGALLTAEVRR